jgi:hypothetical protein
MMWCKRSTMMSIEVRMPMTVVYHELSVDAGGGEQLL